MFFFLLVFDVLFFLAPQTIKKHWKLHKSLACGGPAEWIFEKLRRKGPRRGTKRGRRGKDHGLGSRGEERSVAGEDVGCAGWG